MFQCFGSISFKFLAGGFVKKTAKPFHSLVAFTFWLIELIIDALQGWALHFLTDVKKFKKLPLVSLRSSGGLNAQITSLQFPRKGFTILSRISLDCHKPPKPHSRVRSVSISSLLHNIALASRAAVTVRKPNARVFVCLHAQIRQFKRVFCFHSTMPWTAQDWNQLLAQAV